MPDDFGDIPLIKAIFRKIFEGETLIRIKITTPFQIFCGVKINSIFIFRSIGGPDGTNVREISGHEWIKKLFPVTMPEVH